MYYSKYKHAKHRSNHELDSSKDLPPHGAERADGRANDGLLENVLKMSKFTQF